MTTGKKTKIALQGRFSAAKVRRPLSVGQSVRIAREVNELRQNELAERAGIAQSTISAIETDRVKLGAERAKTLVRSTCIRRRCCFRGGEPKTRAPRSSGLLASAACFGAFA